MFTVIGGKFIFQVQDSDLKYFFWRFEKHIALSEKSHLREILLFYFSDGDIISVISFILLANDFI